MVLRRAVNRMKKQRTLRLAIRAALSVAVVGVSGSIAGAQQADFALPALPTHVSAPTQGDFQLPPLPTMPHQQSQESPKGHIAKLFGFANRPDLGKKTAAQLPALPTATAPTDEAQITWTTRQANTNSRWTINPHVASAESNAAGEVVAASAEAPAYEQYADENSGEESHAITMTISGSDKSDSLIDVDIPLMLPSYEEPAPKQTFADRQPEIIKKKTQIRLSDSDAQSRASVSLPPQVSSDAQTAVTQFSLSDSSANVQVAQPKPIAAPSSVPAAPRLTDMLPSRPAIQAQLPAAPMLDVAAPSTPPTAPAASVSREIVSNSQLATPKPESRLLPVESSKDDFPSTTSSRGVAQRLSDSSQSTRKPMQVAIEGQPARVVSSGESPTFGSSSELPQPTFDTARDNSTNRYQVGQQAPLPSPQPVRARLASQTKSVTSSTDDAQAFESSRKSEKTRSLPPEALAKTTRLSVVVEQTVPMSVRSSIVQTSVEDPSVCQLIQSGDRSLSLVGLKAGSTRVAIVTSADGSEPKVRVYEVSVGRGAKAEYGLAELAAGIDETVTRLYPSSRIRVTAGEGHLVVSGTAGSEEEARRVLALVRRTSLMPVTDKLDAR